MHCNLRPPDAKPVFFRFKWDVRVKLKVSQPISGCLIAFLLLIPYFTLWPWPLTFDLWHSSFLVCGMWCVKLYTKFERNRTILDDLNIWPYDLDSRVMCFAMLWDTFHKVDIQSANPLLKINDFLMLIRYVTLWPWPLTCWPWTFLVDRMSHGQTLPNFSEI